MKIRFFILLNFVIVPVVFAENIAKQTKADTTKKNINEIVVTAQRIGISSQITYSSVVRGCGVGIQRALANGCVVAT